MASSHGYYTLSLLTLLLLPCSFLAQNRSQVINVGSSLTAGEDGAAEQAWISPSGDFAFGFQQLQRNDIYLLAIWYNKIPDKTIVWYANGDDPAPTRSKVELTSDRGLVLTNPQGAEIWRSEISMNASYGLMNDTGNFMVKSTTDGNLWQSFNYPKDTLLPGQSLERGGRILNSRLRETNFSLGRFQFRLLGDGDGVLNFNNMPTGFAYDTYYKTNTADTNASNAGLTIVFDESGYLYTLRASNRREVITPGSVVSADEYYHRVILHFDGVLAQYSYPKNSSRDNNWDVIFRIPDNICNSFSGLGTGACGFNAVCKLSEDRRATCECPPRFTLIDQNDVYGGCKPADFYVQFCDDEGDDNGPNSEFEFIELSNTDWPTSDYEQYCFVFVYPFLLWYLITLTIVLIGEFLFLLNRYSPYNLQDCQKACLDDCFCNVLVFRNGSCWKKKLPLSNGRQGPVNARSLIKVRKGNYTERKLPPSQFPSEKKNQNSFILLVVSLLLGGSAVINFIFIGLLGFGSLVFYHKKLIPVSQSCKSNLVHFSYIQLAEATNGFNEELGRGSFGIVYKGATEIAIAVKKLDRVVEDSEKEFRTEVEVIGQTHHKNLVKLVGFCDEGQHRLLVYEFLKNGTLANWLFKDIKLCWEQRTRVAFGIAKGLVYLHEECTTQIIHCDIKPQNILLDDNLDAKIADFGLAKLLMLDQSKTFTAIRGTKGYVAPEWFRNLPVTPKVDVYSYGVLLLEIVCRRRNVDAELSEDEAILIDWAYDCFVDGKLDVLVANDEEAMDDLNKVERFLMVALWCIQEDPNLRPTMNMVLLMLQGIIQVAVPPCPSKFVVGIEK